MLALLAWYFGHPPFLREMACGGARGPGDSPGAFLYAEGTIHDFSLEISDEAWDGLGRGRPDAHATLTYAGVHWDVGLRLKGSSTFSGMDGKPSFKIDLGEWVDGQELLGVRRLTLNSMKFDATMMREHVAYHLFKQMGVPAPRHGYARVRVNGEAYGLYGLVETMDKQFLRRNWPGDSVGNLYDTRYNWADLTWLGLPFFELQEGEPAEPYDDLHELIAAFDRGSAWDVLEREFDRDEVLAMLAVDIASGNWDGYSRNTNNYLLYHATAEDRWHVIPWGQDGAFQGGGSAYIGVRGRIASACLAESRCRAALAARVLDVLDVWEGDDLVGYARETWAAIAADCEADERRDQRCAPDDLLDALEDRAASLRDELE